MIPPIFLPRVARRQIVAIFGPPGGQQRKHTSSLCYMLDALQYRIGLVEDRWGRFTYVSCESGRTRLTSRKEVDAFVRRRAPAESF